jgi:hypothetical protein
VRGAERGRLEEDLRRAKNWKRWGTYLAERQWGTVREDYSADGDAWRHFTHEQALSRAYRWGEDGLLGWTDRECRLCFAPSLWNGRDPILKERLFGLSGLEGNHGEDCKELYYYLDATPTHSYAKALYKYPQAEFPYEKLRRENARRSRREPEYEIEDTGIFDDGSYFDVVVEYAKAEPDDILIRISATNRAAGDADLVVLPTLWFRNTWIWGCEHEGCTLKPRIRMLEEGRLATAHETLGEFRFSAGPDPAGRLPEFLFTENESNTRKLWNKDAYTLYVKDALHDFVVGGRPEAVNPRKVGTKAAALYKLRLGAGETAELRLRLCPLDSPARDFKGWFDGVFANRISEADAFYASVMPPGLASGQRAVYRQAAAGMLWSKQFYHYSVQDWLRGDVAVMEPPKSRLEGRNVKWRHHLFNRDVLLVPDKWEYPWYAAWDQAFQAVAISALDPQLAKDQLLLPLREWYMHPSGQLPAYEYALDDVNPPVHAWACLRVYEMAAGAGKRDRLFLERAFHKLLINFTWWVNRQDPDGNNLFGGGFLGLDNIGVFDRSKPLPSGGQLRQADATAWMAFYCTTMLAIAIELARENPAYEDVASKFFEHFVSIADAMNRFGGAGLWDEEDGFYYDWLQCDGQSLLLKIRSMVGIIPLFAVQVLHSDVLDRMPGFRQRMLWFVRHRGDLASHTAWMEGCSEDRNHQLLAIPTRERLERVLRRLLDEDEFLSPYGIRSLSRYHAQHPYRLTLGGLAHEVRYQAGDSDSELFGGNSNWRGPVWLPMNFLVIESLRQYDHFYGNTLRIEYPTGSGRTLPLGEVADDLARRLCGLFQPDDTGARPCHGRSARYAGDAHFKDLLLFHEYFHGDTGQGQGAAHQTGWTGLVLALLDRAG